MSLTNLLISLLPSLISQTQKTKILDWLIEVFNTPGKTLSLEQ